VISLALEIGIFCGDLVPRFSRKPLLEAPGAIVKAFIVPKKLGPHFYRILKVCGIRTPGKQP
jgi:hypothetical protein